MLLLHNTCEKYNVPPHEYMFDYELTSRDKFDIDALVNVIGSNLQSEINEEELQKAEAKNGSK